MFVSKTGSDSYDKVNIYLHYSIPLHPLQVSLTVDHPQKVLVMGEAQDYGTCVAMKKNGDPCSQIVNMVGLISLGFVALLTRSCSLPPSIFLFSTVRVPVLPVSRQGPV